MNPALDLVAKGQEERLDKFLARHLTELSRVRIQRLIESGDIRVNGSFSRASSRLKAGDSIHVSLPEAEPTTMKPEAIPLNILYEDGDILVIDKPPGLPVHPSHGHPDHTLVNAVLAHTSDLSGIGGVIRPGIVHRLDKDTSGLIVIAKNDAAHRELSRQMKEREVRKGYIGLVWGIPEPPEAVIDAPIGRDFMSRMRMAIIADGREAQTRYKVIRRWNEVSLIELFPKTGRTHQIRVHLSSIGHPLVGDKVYGRKRDGWLTRQFLHANSLGFRLPSSGEFREFTSPLPPDLQALLDTLERGEVPEQS